ncbi:MAG: GNAT family N-acetyltransferase [Vampirovibrionales bacterium]
MADYSNFNNTPYSYQTAPPTVGYSSNSELNTVNPPPVQSNVLQEATPNLNTTAPSQAKTDENGWILPTAAALTTTAVAIWQHKNIGKLVDEGWKFLRKDASEVKIPKTQVQELVPVNRPMTNGEGIIPTHPSAKVPEVQPPDAVPTPPKITEPLDTANSFDRASLVSKNQAYDALDDAEIQKIEQKILPAYQDAQFMKKSTIQINGKDTPVYMTYTDEYLNMAMLNDQGEVLNLGRIKYSNNTEAKNLEIIELFTGQKNPENMKGFGTAMTDAALQRSRDLGYQQRIRLLAQNSSSSPYEFYRKMGFEPSASTLKYEANQSQTEAMDKLYQSYKQETQNNLEVLTKEQKRVLRQKGYEPFINGIHMIYTGNKLGS